MTELGSTEGEVPDRLLGWCLVANVARETARGEGGLDIQCGTRHFAPGALLWLPRVHWDPGTWRVRAVGRHRRNARRYVNMVVRLDDLENFRVKGVYSPGLVRSLNRRRHDPAEPDVLQKPWPRELAQSYADAWNNLLEAVCVDGVRDWQVWVPNPPPAEIHRDGETLHLAHYSSRGPHYSRTPPPVEWTPPRPET